MGDRPPGFPRSAPAATYCFYDAFNAYVSQVYLVNPTLSVMSLWPRGPTCPVMTSPTCDGLWYTISVLLSRFKATYLVSDVLVAQMDSHVSRGGYSPPWRSGSRTSPRPRWWVPPRPDAPCTRPGPRYPPGALSTGGSSQPGLESNTGVWLQSVPHIGSYQKSCAAFNMGGLWGISFSRICMDGCVILFANFFIEFMCGFLFCNNGDNCTAWRFLYRKDRNIDRVHQRLHAVPCWKSAYTSVVIVHPKNISK